MLSISFQLGMFVWLKDKFSFFINVDSDRMLCKCTFRLELDATYSLFPPI